METIHLPKRWYIAEINHLQKQLDSLPLVKTGAQRGKRIVRIYKSEGYKVITAGRPDYAEYEAIAQKRLLLSNKLQILKKEWRQFFKTSFEVESSKYVVCPNKKSVYNSECWDKLIDDECTAENDKHYEFDGHDFRSRLEQFVAQAVKELHLEYKYDSGLKLGTSKVFTDFAFNFEVFNCTTFCECLGMLDSKDYVISTNKKLSVYFFNNIYINRELFIISGDSKYIPTAEEIKLDLVFMVEMLCARYMKEVN